MLTGIVTLYKQVVATLGNFWIYPIFNVLSPFWR